MPGFDIRVTISGLQSVMARNDRRIARLRSNSDLGKAIQGATAEAHRYATAVTHVDTGSLRASHRMEVNGLRGRVYLAPEAINPRSRQKTSVYGYYEHERGGTHAFYQRTVNERGPQIRQRWGVAIKEIVSGK